MRCGVGGLRLVNYIIRRLTKSISTSNRVQKSVIFGNNVKTKKRQEQYSVNRFNINTSQYYNKFDTLHNQIHVD